MRSSLCAAHAGCQTPAGVQANPAGWGVCAADWTYAIESGLHEMMLQSEHRTLDPEEAGARARAAERN